MFQNVYSLSIYSNAAKVRRVGLRKCLLLSDLLTGFSAAEVKTYVDPATLANDADVDAVTKAQALQWFAQENPAQAVKLGKFDYDGNPSSISDVLDALLATDDDWFGLVAGGTAASATTKANILAIASWAETARRFYHARTADADVVNKVASNVAEELNELAYGYTALSYVDTNSQMLDLAVMARGLGFDPDQRAASWAFMNPLRGLSLVSGLTTETAENLEEQYVNRYDSLDGVGCWGYEGVLVNGKSIKGLISREWFSRTLQSRIIQYQLDCAARGGQIAPYNKDGLASFRGLIQDVLNRGVALKHFASLADEEEDTSGNVKAPTVWVPTLAEVTAENRAAKTLPWSCTMTAAGEILKVQGTAFFGE